MPIINRDFDATEKRQALYETYGASGFPMGTGFTQIIGIVPFNSLLASLYVAATGVSGAPAYTFNAYRFIVGAGFTSIPITNATLTPAEFGTSGPVYTGVSFAVGNATFLTFGQTLLSGDMLVARSSGANTAALNVTFGAVVQATDDYIKYLGN